MPADHPPEESAIRNPQSAIDDWTPTERISWFPVSAEEDLDPRVAALVQRQREVLDFVEFLERKSGPTAGRPPLRGIFADLGVSISAEEIDEARREAWSGFPREDI